MKAEFKPSVQFRIASWAMVGLACLSASLGTQNAQAGAVVDAICGKKIPGATQDKPDDKIKMFKTYCETAQSSDAAASANATLWKAWAMVAVTCTTACALAMTNSASVLATTLSNDGIGAYLSPCSLANAGTSVIDGMLTHNFMAAIEGIAGNAMSAVVTKALIRDKMVTAKGDGIETSHDLKPVNFTTAEGKSVELEKEKTVAVKTQEKKSDRAACGTAISATLISLAKYNTMNAAEDTTKTSLEYAQALLSSQFSANSDTGTSFAVSNNNAASVSSPGQAAVSASSETASANSSDPCSAAKNGGGPQSFISCAVSNDSNLPGFVSSPGFIKDFSKATNQPFERFANTSISPSEAILGGIAGAGISPSSLGNLSSTLQQMQASLDNNVAGTSYAHGAGSAPTAPQNDSDLGGMMAAMMGQFAPKEGEKQIGSNAAAIAFGKIQGRSPAAITEDRTINLFDRITLRYLTIDKKFSFGQLQ